MTNWRNVLPARYVALTQFVLLALLMHGCSSVPKQQTEQGAEAEAPTAPPKALRLSGRLSIRQGKEAQSGKVRWLHDAPHHEIAVLSPIGTMVASIVQDAQKVTLTTSRKETFEAPDADQLMEAILGWNLPITGMQYWVLGRPAPPEAAAQTELGPDNRLARLTQNDWHIEYSNYRPVGSSEFPGKIVLSRDDIEIRFVLDSVEPVASEH